MIQPPQWPHRECSPCCPRRSISRLRSPDWRRCSPGNARCNRRYPQKTKPASASWFGKECRRWRYVLNNAAGTIARVGVGAIPDPSDVKISYLAESQIFLTEYRNLILGLGRDIRMERDRNIFASTTEFAITTRVAVEIEETDAVVLGINVGLA